MVYPPGQGKCGQYLMQLWRQYLEQYAEHEGSIENQIVVASYHAAEIFGFLSLSLDRDGRYKSLIEERVRHFQEGSSRARVFGDHLVNATFAIYNHLNTLGRQFTAASREARELLQQVDEKVRETVLSEGQIERSASAMRAAFPTLSLMTLMLDSKGTAAPAIRQVEQRFASGASRQGSAWDQLLNSLYRIVEMMQLLVVLSDPDLRGQVDQIASRFEEEDQPAELTAKLRNGFCRMFELGHLLGNHLDEILS